MDPGPPGRRRRRPGGDPGASPYTYPQHAYWRDLAVKDPERREALLDAFSTLAVAQARRSGLLLPGRKGSLTHPDPSRVIYGDGTVVRPIYRIQPDNDDDTDSTQAERPSGVGEAADAGTVPVRGRRQDSSAALFHRHDGPIHGNDFVVFFARGDDPGSRVVLGVDRVDVPGREAETAVRLVERIALLTTGGVQAVVYDGALKGAHIDRVMRRCGLLVVNNVAAAVRNDDEVVVKRRPLGTYSHRVGRRSCSHSLHIEDGSVIDMGLADDGTPLRLSTATRKQVKRVQRADGTYRFHLGVTIPCRRSNFTIWLSPHARNETDNLPEHLRLIPPGDPDFKRIYGRRNDSESFNSQYKRTLLVDRAASVGWERQLFDVLAFAVLQNSLSCSAQASVGRLSPLPGGTRRSA